MGIQQVEQPVANMQVSAPNVLQRNAKIDSLTGLRFIAACLVFMAHTPISPTFPTHLQAFLSSGGNGVTLFFSLSGFVLCYNYYDVFSKRFAPSLKSFFVARFARIYPLHFLTFLLYFSSGLMEDGSVASISDQLQHTDRILANITLTHAWNLNLLPYYNGPSWSISVEAFFYLCFPLLIVLLFKRATKLRHLCLIGFITFSAIFLFATWFTIHPINSLSYWWIYTFPLARLGDFTLGCVAARIYFLHLSKPITPREQALGVTLLLLSIAAVIVVMMSIPTPLTVLYKLDSAYCLFFVVIMYTLARYVTPLSRFLSTKVLVLLGEASYAFYLLHVPILYFGLTKPYLSTHLSGDLYIVMQFLLTIVVSLGAHTYIEKPLRKIIRQVFASKASIPASALPVPTVVGS